MRMQTILRRSSCGLLAALLLTCMTAPLESQQQQHAQQTTQASPDAKQAQPQREQRESVTKVIQVKRGEANRLAKLLYTAEASAIPDSSLGVIVVTGPMGTVAKYEELVREIEKSIAQNGPATRNVQLTLYILGIVEDDSATVSGPLQGVVAELKKTLPFPGYRLLETSTVRARVAQGVEVAGILPGQLAEGTHPPTYEFRARISAVTPQDRSPVISLSRLDVSLRILNPGGGSFSDIGINTALDIASGSTAVVGKSGSAGDTQGYLMLLEARVLD